MAGAHSALGLGLFECLHRTGGQGSFQHLQTCRHQTPLLSLFHQFSAPDRSATLSPPRRHISLLDPSMLPVSSPAPAGDGIVPAEAASSGTAHQSDWTSNCIQCPRQGGAGDPVRPRSGPHDGRRISSGQRPRVSAGPRAPRPSHRPWIALLGGRRQTSSSPMSDALDGRDETKPRARRG
jgi:hypothetical protein